MKRPNFIFITMDAVRHDRLSCYGQGGKTPVLDSIASDGVLFEEVISASNLTPVAHASILTGLYPHKHGLRTPFDRVRAKLTAEYFHENGYRTSGFVGVSLLGSAKGFNSGFDHFNEPDETTAWRKTCYVKGGFKHGAPTDDLSGHSMVLWGNNWTDRMFQWIRSNHNLPFFLWGHYFECHEGAEKLLLEQGHIKKQDPSEHRYYDTKIRHMDACLLGGLLHLLRELGLEESTYLVITSDHGANLGEHPIPPKKDLGVDYPQHVTMFDCDIRIPLIMKGPGLPSGKRVKGMVRSVDILPTILDLAGIEVENTDGVSLAPFIERGKAGGLTAYAEELFQLRGPGDYQAMRDQKHKLILDRRCGTVHFFDLEQDAGERHPVLRLDQIQKEKKTKWIEFCDLALFAGL